MSDKPSAAISRAGIGRQGYCKLCSLADSRAQTDLDERIRAGWKSTAIINLLRDRYGVTVNRQTFYSHKPHATHPRDRLVTAVQRSEQRALQTKPVASTEQFLEAIRDAGYQRAVNNPEEVTIDHALKAANILANQKQSGGDIHILLAKIVTGSEWRSDVVIEGESREVMTAQ